MSSPISPSLSSNVELQEKMVKAALTDPNVYEAGFEASRVFAIVSVLLASPSAPRKQLVKSMNTVYLFTVKNEEGKEISWWVDMKKKGRLGKVAPGAKSPLKPDVTIFVSDKDLVGLATGQLMPQKLFAAKRLRVRGNLDKALNVEKILSHERQKLEGLAPKEPLATPKEKGRWMGVAKAVKSKL